ncbi:TPA: hypothetical protein N0F65_005433, partial [Lagenidium giganteum]
SRFNAWVEYQATAEVVVVCNLLLQNVGTLEKWQCVVESIHDFDKSLRAIEDKTMSLQQLVQCVDEELAALAKPASKKKKRNPQASIDLIPETPYHMTLRLTAPSQSHDDTDEEGNEAIVYNFPMYRVAFNPEQFVTLHAPETDASQPPPSAPSLDASGDPPAAPTAMLGLPELHLDQATFNASAPPDHPMLGDRSDSANSLDLNGMALVDTAAQVRRVRARKKPLYYMAVQAIENVPTNTFFNWYRLHGKGDDEFFEIVQDAIHILRSGTYNVDIEVHHELRRSSGIPFRVFNGERWITNSLVPTFTRDKIFVSIKTMVIRFREGDELKVEFFHKGHAFQATRMTIRKVVQ